jgi:hypothetical protein
VTRPRLGRIFWIGAAAILVVAALVALAAILRGDFSSTDWRILITLGALLYTGGTALAGLALAERGRTQALVGWTVVAAAPVCLALVLWAIWRFAGDGDGGTEVKLAWSSVLVLLAGLVSATGLLLARGSRLARLAGAAGGLAALAAALSVAGVWTESGSDTFVKALAALWILAGLGYFLVPILARFSSAASGTRAVRVLAELDGVELVASRSPLEGVRAEPPAPGERLVLRRRPPTR